MAKHLPWYKRDVDAWRGGTRGMSFELRGLYSECLDAMWDMQGPIPLDLTKLAVMLCCNPRTLRKLLPQLVGMGKLIETPDGYANARMMAEIAAANPGGIRGEFDRNSKGIQPEFEPKVSKNAMFSTRDLEVEEEVEKEKEGAACALDEILISNGRVKIGDGIAAELASEFPAIDLNAVAIRAAVVFAERPMQSHASRLAVVRRSALFEHQAPKPKPRMSSGSAGRESALDILRNMDDGKLHG